MNKRQIKFLEKLPRVGGKIVSVELVGQHLRCGMRVEVRDSWKPWALRTPGGKEKI